MAKTTFMMPKGDTEFDNLEEGEKMQASCRIRKEAGGKACLVAINGQTLPGYSDDDGEDTEDDADESKEDDGINGDDGDMMDAMDKEMQ